MGKVQRLWELWRIVHEQVEAPIPDLELLRNTIRELGTVMDYFVMHELRPPRVDYQVVRSRDHATCVAADGALAQAGDDAGGGVE